MIRITKLLSTTTKVSFMQVFKTLFKDDRVFNIDLPLGAYTANTILESTFIAAQ